MHVIQNDDFSFNLVSFLANKVKMEKFRILQKSQKVFVHQVHTVAVKISKNIFFLKSILL